MKPKTYRLVPVHVMPEGNFRSFPAEIGTPAPLQPFHDPRPMEHPQRMSTVSGFEILPMSPSHDAILDLEHVPGLPFGRA